MTPSEQKYNQLCDLWPTS